MDFPELLSIDAFCQFSGAPGKVVARLWIMAEHIPHLIVEPIAKFRDDIIDGVAIDTTVAAVLDQRDRCIHGAEDVIASLVDRWIEITGFFGHAPSSPFASTSSETLKYAQSSAAHDVPVMPRYPGRYGLRIFRKRQRG
jgi:hypothetical protein